MLPQIPYIPASAPFTPEQRAWLNGYLAGLFSNANTAQPIVPAKGESSPVQLGSLSILVGSQTGNAEQLAKKLCAQARQRSFQARLLPMSEFASIEFEHEERIVIVTSTWGDGDPPENAVAFWEYLNSAKARRLDHLSYAVLGLGDRNYADFCGAAKKFDLRLEELGAKRLVARAECDTDFEQTARQWIENLWPLIEKSGALTNDEPAPDSASSPNHPTQSAIQRNGATVEAKRNGLISNSTQILNESNSAITAPAAGSRSAADRDPRAAYHRTRPFPARLLVNRNLNSRGSAKDTRHFEISLSGSGFDYEVGDALGVMPANCPRLVEDLLKALGGEGTERVLDPEDREIPFRDALLLSYQITQIPMKLLELVATRFGDSTFMDLLAPANKSALDEFLFGREIIDLLIQFPSAKIPAAEFVAGLRRLQPRLYSIASSPKAHEGKVHLTVSVVRYVSHGRERKGVCSTFLAERVNDETTVPVFIQPSNSFRLPAKGETPIIMIGPGTGIAPFRAFLEERRAIGARGRNWLFFGDQCRATDFLYRDELERMQSDGILTRLDTAFSRDQAEKLYVQHRMCDNAVEFWNWLEAGAHVYVCGDAKRVAKDVDLALHEVIRIAGGKDADQAAEYVQNLKTEKRYQRDVY